jgi:hypothetical protein
VRTADINKRRQLHLKRLIVKVNTVLAVRSPPYFEAFTIAVHTRFRHFKLLGNAAKALSGSMEFHCFSTFLVSHGSRALPPSSKRCRVPTRSTVHFDLDLLRTANNSGRPMAFLGLLSFGGSEIPSKALLDFQALKAYLRWSRRTCTPSLHVASIRFPVSLKPANPLINSRTGRSSIRY